MEDIPNGGKRVVFNWLTKDRESSALPTIMKLLMIFIDRIGFPVLAFLVMTALCSFTIYKLAPVFDNMAQTLVEIKSLLERK